MKGFSMVAFAVMLCGCVTPSGRVGARQNEKVLLGVAEKGAVAADPVVVEAARVQGVLCRQLSAPEEVPEPTAENLSATADAMDAESEAAAQAGGLLKDLLGYLPYGGLVVTAGGALLALFRSRKLAATALAGVKVLNAAKHTLEDVESALGKPDKATDWKELAANVGGLVADIKGLGKFASPALRELAALHAKLKAKG